MKNKNHTENRTDKTDGRGILKVAVAAASDRYNFGDVLLPIVFEQYLKRAARDRGEEREIRVTQFALFSADLTSVGGLKVKALCEADSSYDCVVMAGGEVLAAGYITMHLSTGPGRVLTAAERLLRKIPPTRPLLERFLQKAVCRRKNAGMPWISVLWGFRDREELAGKGARLFAEKPEDVIRLLQAGPGTGEERMHG